MAHTHAAPTHEPVVVVGLGSTGLSVVRHLRALGETVLVMDSRTAPPGLDALRAACPDVPLVLGELAADTLVHARRVVLSPGVPLSEPAVAAAVNAGVEVIGDIELFAREAPAPVAAITGSNGKSTVTALLGEMARAAGLAARVGGNLTPPALDLLAGDPPDLFVLELSSFQLETTWSLAPAVAAILNISADHLDRYADLAAYVTAKARILAGAGTAVLNLDDPLVSALRADTARVLGFSVDGHPDAHARIARRDGEDWLLAGDAAVMPAGAVPLPGRHNLANALAAVAAGDALGLQADAMARAIVDFRGLAHRCTPVAEHAGVRWIDDSKGTNVGAAIAAIDGLASGCNLVLIAGGLGKGQDFSPLAASMARHVHTAVLIGSDADAIAAIAPASVHVLRAAGMDEAVALAGEAAAAGDTVLLSPACASFDQFAGFAERGDAFARAVRERCTR